MNEKVTIDYLLNIFQKLSNNGHGDMIITVNNDTVYTDDIGINYDKKEVTIRGNLYNSSITEKLKRFCDDIEKAKNKFYESEDIKSNKSD